MTQVRNGIRQNPEVTKSIESRVNALLIEEGKISEVLALRDLPGWKRLNDEFMQRIGTIDVKLQSFESLSQESRALLLKERKDFVEFVNIMDIKEQELERISQSRTTAQRELKHRQPE